MRLLLDTHVMLWWALGDRRLSVAGRDAIEDRRNACAVSTASLWEVAIKSAGGRGLPDGISAHRFAALVDEAGFALLDVRRAHAIAVEDLPSVHGDPFDRLMVAQALVEGMRVLTHDRALGSYGDHVMLV